MLVISKEQKVEKSERYGIMVKDSDQIGQLSKLCLTDFFLRFIISGACQLLWGEKSCTVMSFPEVGREKKRAVKRLLSSTNVSGEPNGTEVKS